MKTVVCLTCFLGLLALPFLARAGPDEICCRWVNPAYTSQEPPQMEIRNADGTFADYADRENTDPLRRGTFTIMKKWQDDAGNIWYRIKRQSGGEDTRYELAKISDGGQTLELVIQHDDFPSVLDPANASYRRYTRY